MRTKRKEKAMLETDGKPDDFPRTETFRDCCGSLRTFGLELTVTDGGYFLQIGRAHV